MSEITTSSVIYPNLTKEKSARATIDKEIFIAFILVVGLPFWKMYRLYRLLKYRSRSSIMKLLFLETLKIIVCKYNSNTQNS